MKIFNEVMKTVISVCVIAVFLHMGYKIFDEGQNFTKIQADAFANYIAWLGFIVLPVMFTWFRSALPMLKEIVTVFANLRAGKVETPPYSPSPLPSQPFVMPQPQPVVFPPPATNTTPIEQNPTLKPLP